MVINNIKDLKKYQRLLFSSNRKHLIEKAQAFSDIILRWERYGKPCLSDAALLSEICSNYVKEMSKMYSATGDESLKVKIGAARELIIKDWAPKNEVFNYLNNASNGDKNLDFEQAKKLLKNSHLWNKTKPSTLEAILKEKEE